MKRLCFLVYCFLINKKYYSLKNFLEKLDHPHIGKIFFGFPEINEKHKYYYIGMELGYTNLSNIFAIKKVIIFIILRITWLFSIVFFYSLMKMI